MCHFLALYPYLLINCITMVIQTVVHSKTGKYMQKTFWLLKWDLGIFMYRQLLWDKVLLENHKLGACLYKVYRLQYWHSIFHLRINIWHYTIYFFTFNLDNLISQVSVPYHFECWSRFVFLVTIMFRTMTSFFCFISMNINLWFYCFRDVDFGISFLLQKYNKNI